MCVRPKRTAASCRRRRLKAFWVQRRRLLSTADYTDSWCVTESERGKEVVRDNLKPSGGGDTRRPKCAYWAPLRCQRWSHLIPLQLWPSLRVPPPLCRGVWLTSSSHAGRPKGYEICSARIRVNQPTLPLQFTAPLGGWRERDTHSNTQTAQTTYPLFSKASGK